MVAVQVQIDLIFMVEVEEGFLIQAEIIEEGFVVVFLMINHGLLRES